MYDIGFLGNMDDLNIISIRYNGESVSWIIFEDNIYQLLLNIAPPSDIKIDGVDEI